MNTYHSNIDFNDSILNFNIDCKHKIQIDGFWEYLNTVTIYGIYCR